MAVIESSPVTEMAWGVLPSAVVGCLRAVVGAGPEKGTLDARSSGASGTRIEAPASRLADRLGTLAVAQRQLAGANFAAMAVTQRATQPYATQAAKIVATQAAVTRNFARSINFSSLAANPQSTGHEPTKYCSRGAAVGGRSRQGYRLLGASRRPRLCYMRATR